MAVESVADGVYRIGLGYVNAYLVDGDEGVTIVDTLLPKKQDAVEAALRDIGRSFDDVRAILLTHSHADHSGSAAAVKAKSGADLYASAADAPAIRGEMKPPSPPMYVRPLTWVMAALPAPPAAEVDHLVSEASGDVLPGDLRAIDTPGHTPGHTSYLLDRAGGVLFVGDAAKATRDGRVVRGFFNRPTTDIDGSLAHIADLDFEIAAFGHSAPILGAVSGAFRSFVDSSN